MNAQRKMLRHLITVALSSAVVLGVNAPAYAADQCLIFAINDKGVNTSQVVSSNPYQNYAVSPIGKEYVGADIETIDFTYSKTPDGLKLYGASGDNTSEGYEPGHLFFIDHMNGDITDLGQICLDLDPGPGETLACGLEVSALSFKFTENSLWGWAEDCGLFSIPQSNIPPNQDNSQGSVKAEIEFRSLFGSCDPDAPKKVGDSGPGGIEDLTWSNDGQVLYASLTCSPSGDTGLVCPEAKTDIYGYEPNSAAFWLVASLAGQYEAMEMIPATPDQLAPESEGLANGSILLGQHGELTMTFQELVIEPDENGSLVGQEGTFVSRDSTVDTFPFRDLEGIAWSCPDCIEMPGAWEYAADASNDSTFGINYTNIAVGGVDNTGEFADKWYKFEIFGMAVKQDRDTVYVAFNTNLPTTGLVNTDAKDDHIGWGDVLFNFGGNNYGVHFAANQSGVPSVGLYKDVNTKDVTSDNVGWKHLRSYRRHLNNNGVEGSLGDLPIDTTYFPQSDERSVPMVMTSGTKVEADFEMLDAEDLEAMGLDFESNIPDSSGKYTFGFKFDRTDDMVGEFTAHVFIECLNDGIALVGELKPRQCEDTMSN